MGNATTMFKRSSQNKPRVVLESPQISETDASKSTRVKFANVKSDSVGFRMKPQMMDIGQVPTDHGRVKFHRTQSQSQTVGLGSNLDMNKSQTSVNTNTSSSSAPVNGIWDPIMDPHDRTHWSKKWQLKNKVNENPDFYTGFKESEIWGEYRTTNSLSKVEEI